MATTYTRRPRNVGILQAAAMLYGDWGTSKAYVLGLAFAAAAYSSFWLIASVCVLMCLVAVNYITICKYNPTGGGVYASVRRRSEIFSLIGAFFLIADYIITASLSALSSFSYLGVQNPEIWGIFAIFLIGCVNFFGPKHTGTLAFVIGVPTVIIVALVSISSIPFFGEAVEAIQPLKGGWFKNWIHFVSIIVALSGIESIANTTGVMKLDPGSTYENPSVHQTSKKAILLVMAEVCVFTALLGFAMNALPELKVVNSEVFNASGESVRDNMIKYMGENFVSREFNVTIGKSFGTLIGVIFSILLLSAVNTAQVAMVSLFFVMSRDGELPTVFQKINRFGVPHYSQFAAMVIPGVMLLIVSDIVSLADLYAVGFVGAIATNLGYTSIDRELPMRLGERIFMFSIFIIMALIEVSLLIYKPEARHFVFFIVTMGLILRALVIESRQKALALKGAKVKHASLFLDDAHDPLHEGALLCAANTIGKTLQFAIEEAARANQPLYVLFIREQKIITEEDHLRSWIEDRHACEVYDYVRAESIKKDSTKPIKFVYAISDDSARTIVDIAKKLQVSQIILGKSRRSTFSHIIRGNIITEVSEIIPKNMDLLVIS